MSRMKVYLAGGMKGDWQDQLISILGKQVEFIDPRDHCLIAEEDYTDWDLKGVFECDVLFAYMEKSNPSGYGMMLEIGYAKALGKLIIFAHQGRDNDDRKGYFGMARVCADAQFTTFGHALSYLEGLVRGWYK